MDSSVPPPVWNSPLSKVQRYDAQRGVKVFLLWLSLALGAVALSLLLVLVILAFAGYPALGILHRWIIGAAGNRFNFAASVADACPLLLTGLAAGVAFRSGVLNIGAQGQFLLGALTSVALTTRFLVPGPSWLVMVVAIAAASVAGGLWAVLASVLERYRGVPIVLSTILLNFVALYLVRAALHGPLQAADTSAPQSPQLKVIYWLPILIRNTDFHLGIPLAFAVALAMALVLGRTNFGFELLITGLNPRVANLVGVPVARRQFAIMFLSGCCAGLGGAVQVLGVTHFMLGNFGNYGYTGIAVALLGRLNPIGIAVAAVFFGMLDTGSRFVEESSLALPHQMANVVKGVIILAMLVATAWMM
ncbi:MAG: ABC transporter permease, partial [Phycisphaerae bacterium]|nr:ABC transporter permease [Phycisphaerae bacterium]